MIDDAIMQVRQSETFKSKVDEKVKVDNIIITRVEYASAGSSFTTIP